MFEIVRKRSLKKENRMTIAVDERSPVTLHRTLGGFSPSPPRVR
jgi:hypothetical protein